MNRKKAETTLHGLLSGDRLRLVFKPQSSPQDIYLLGMLVGLEGGSLTFDPATKTLLRQIAQSGRWDRQAHPSFTVTPLPALDVGNFLDTFVDELERIEVIS